MSKIKHYYIHSENKEEPQDTIKRDEFIEILCWSSDPMIVAETSAEDELINAGSDLNDPSLWPRIYHIYDPDKNYLGCFSVDLEYVPEFYVSKI